MQLLFNRQTLSLNLFCDRNRKWRVSPFLWVDSSVVKNWKKRVFGLTRTGQRIVKNADILLIFKHNPLELSRFENVFFWCVWLIILRKCSTQNVKELLGSRFSIFVRWKYIIGKISQVRVILWSLTKISTDLKLGRQFLPYFQFFVRWVKWWNSLKRLLLRPVATNFGQWSNVCQRF